jgi:AcrR family transcriptional regulator
MGRTGRRPGRTVTRQAILTAARSAFAARGYDAVSLRQIAAEADVDPALVHHYFGGKDQLFIAALDVPVNPAELVPKVLAGDPDQMGARVVRAFLHVWDSPAGGPAAALVRSAVSHPWSARMLREFLTSQVLRRVLHTLKLPDAELRGSLVASQIMGLAMTRYIIRVEPIASLPAERVVALVGPTVQRYLTGDLPCATA